MKKSFLILILLINFNNIYSQDVEKLKEYEYFIESKNYEKNWIRKYILKDGLNYKIQDIHNEQGLKNEYIYFYNKKNNVIKEEYVMNKGFENEGNIRINHKLTYKNNRLIKDRSKETSWTIKYSNFDKLDNPQVIESIGKNKQTKKNIKYDDKGNILKLTEITYNNGTKVIKKTEFTSYKYDQYNNVIELLRSSVPKMEYPIKMIGGPHLYENEFYKYEYNKDGLWTKKVCIINGNESYIWKREYK